MKSLVRGTIWTRHQHVFAVCVCVCVCVCSLVMAPLRVLADLTGLLRVNKMCPSSGADIPMPYSEPLERMAIPQAENIVSAAERLMYRKK